MGIKQQLQEELSRNHVIPKDLLQFVPRGFQDLDHRAIIKLKPELEEYSSEIALAISRVLTSIKAVWNRGGQIKGKFRTPQGLTHLWGDESTEVTISENNVRYKFDFTKIMFAKGNIHERNLLPKKVKPGEIIVDMFAGIGYFSLGMAKSARPAKIYSIEWNPTAFEYLKQNIGLNHVEAVIEPIFGDCKEIVTQLAAEGVEADRIVMGLLPAPVDAIEFALKLAKSEGTIIVYEGVEPKDSTELYDNFCSIASDLNFSCSLIERRIVKAFKPFEYHVVIEILVKPLNSENK